MKKAVAVGVMAIAMLFTMTMASKAAVKSSAYDGTVGVKIGYMSFDEFDGSLALGLEYEMPAVRGFSTVELLYSPLKTSGVYSGVNWEAKMDFFQISVNRLWDFQTGKSDKLAGSLYGGVGLGYGHGDASITVSAPCAGCLATASDDATSLEGNLIVGYKLPANGIKIEGRYIFDESAFLLSVGYLFK
ncbi:MAG: outer membrane beta-barrel protein [bacterium]